MISIKGNSEPSKELEKALKTAKEKFFADLKEIQKSFNITSIEVINSASDGIRFWINFEGVSSIDRY